MKKTLFIILLTGPFTTAVFSQASTNIGINLSSGTNAFPENGRLGLGTSLEYLLPITGESGLKATVAYDWFHHNVSNPDSALTIGISAKSISILPIRIGWQQFISPGKIFVTADIGYYRLITATKYNAFKGGLSYGFGGGYRFQTPGHSYLQLSALYSFNRQNKIWSYNYLTVRAAYGLKFSRSTPK